MHGIGLVGKRLVVPGLLLITGCSAANASESHTELSVSGGGNQVPVSNPGSLRIEVAKELTAIEIQLRDIAGSVQLWSGETRGSINGMVTGAAVAAETGPSDDALAIDIRGMGEAASKVELRLPDGPQVTLRLSQRKGSLATDLTGLGGSRVILSDTGGHVTFVLSGRASQEVEIGRGDGSVTFEVPTSAAVVVWGNGNPVKVPASFDQTAGGGFFHRGADKMSAHEKNPSHPAVKGSTILGSGLLRLSL